MANAADTCTEILQDMSQDVMQELLQQLRAKLPSGNSVSDSTSADMPQPSASGASAQDLSQNIEGNQASNINCMYDDRKLPSLPRFSGTNLKGETTYQRWRYEVLCLQTAGCPEPKLIRVIQKSLFGMAADTLMFLGKQPSLTDILKKFDVLYQDSDDIEVAMAQFYAATQKADESLPAWFTRLESLLNADCLALDSSKKETMLRARFWKGLNNEVLRHGLRHKVDSGLSSVQLLEAARQIQEEDRKSTTVQSQVNQWDKTTQLLKQLSQQMDGLKIRLDKLEQQQQPSYVPQNFSSVPQHFNAQPQHSTFSQQPNTGSSNFKSASYTKPSQSNFRFRGQCFKCRKSGHKAKDCSLNLNVPMSGGHVAPQ
jgi:hypothetical protein